MITKIYRSLDLTQSKDRVLEGYAVVFNSLSEDLGGFREIIRPSAITQELINNSDIIANMDHRNDYMMARLRKGKGNIDLTLDEHGLKFRYTIPDTVKGDELWSHVERGEIDQCSFAFGIDYSDPTAEKYHVDKDGVTIREILKISKLYDISCVINPAYEDTEVYTRDLDHVNENIRINKLNNFYLDLLDEISK